MSTGTAAEGTERPQFADGQLAEIDAAAVPDKPCRWDAFAERWMSLIDGASFKPEFVTAVRPLRLVPVEAGTVGGTERDVIEAAVEAAMIVLEKRWTRAGISPFTQDDGGEADAAEADMRAVLADVYPVIAAAVRAEERAESQADLRHRIEVGVGIESDRRVALAERDEYHRQWQEALAERDALQRRVNELDAAAPVAAPTDPADWQTIASEAVEALRLTREYVGEAMLPARPGWSWFDATNRYRAAAGLPQLPAEPAAGQFTAGEVVCVRCGRRGTHGFVISSGNGDGTRDTYACASSTACDRRGTDLPGIEPPNGDLLEALERSLVQARGDGLPPDTGEAQR